MKNLFRRFIEPYRGLPMQIYIMFIARIINSLGNFVYPLLTLILVQKIGINTRKAGMFMTMAALLSAPGMMLGGKLIDTIGRKKVIIIFQSSAATVFIICSRLKPSMSMAYVLILAPIFTSFCMPAQDAVVADLTTYKNRKEAFSLLYMGHNLGFAIGPLIAGFLYKNHLPLVFIGDAVTTLLSLVLVIFYVEETMNYKKNLKQNDINILEKEEKGSVISILKKRPSLIYFSLISFIYQFAYSQWGFLLPLQLGKIFGENGARYFGTMAAVNGIIIIIFTSTIVENTKGINHLKIISLGGILYTMSFFIFAITSSLIFFFISIAIMTIGEIIVSTNTPTFISINSPRSHRGRINAVLPTIYGSGWALGPVSMGKFSSMYGIQKSWILICMCMIVAVGLMFLLSRVMYKENYNSY
ncbi:MFS transporter [Clostridium rectalis]|uniref:MFS transporter n=1 Tax=Clostridium rectalis TaxID=2040295 RepID=UPI000F63C19B|nr:MFS transporter [Clostridium rectalis]